MRTCLFTLALLVLGCSAATQTGHPPEGAGAASESPAPALRLPKTFVPARYAVRLAIDPEKTDFAGHITIEGTLSEASSVVWLHGEHLTVVRALAAPLAAPAGAPERAPVALVVTPRGQDLLEVRAQEPLAAGSWRFELEYTGALDDLNTAGAFRQRVAGAAYVYTQLEAVYARRVFPCVDEPDSKVPWQLTLDVPETLTAVSNTPVAKTEALTGGSKRYEFQTTKPLPAYLVAFGVGPFEIIDAPPTHSGTPVRVVTLAGRGADAAYAVQTSARIVDLLEDWFGIPYPYEKLDILTIPLTVGFGAMENAGLVTFSERLSLFEQTPASWLKRYIWVRVAAHEFAHQWFGNYVTTAWWDDIWLNEGFADWMETKITARFEPGWHDERSDLDLQNDALDADSVVSARQIRQPIATRDDIFNVFDGITYAKGASVLNMFESYVGAQVFQRGVREYLKSRAHGNATSSDFVSAISKQAGRDLGPAFASFLEQPGAPALSAQLDCGQGAPRLSFTQQRYVPPGSPRPPPGKPWILPVCVAHDRDGQRAETCTLLDAPGSPALDGSPAQGSPAQGSPALDGHSSLALDVRRCPRWILPNVNGRGYYRSQYSKQAVLALRDVAWPDLSWTERRALFFDVAQAARDGARQLGASASTGAAAPAAELIDLSLALSFVPKMLAGADRFTVPNAVRLASELDPLVAAEQRGDYERRLRAMFGSHARKLGVLPKASDDLDAEVSRAELLHAAAWLGRDADLGARAVAHAARWRELPQSVRGTIIELAADADPRIFAAIAAGVKAEPDRARRREMFVALGAVRDPARYVAALELVLDPALDFREALTILVRTSTEATRHLAETFFRTHEAAIFQRLPSEQVAGRIDQLARLFTGGCQASERALAAEMLQHFLRFPGGKRAVEQAMEAMDQCIEVRKTLEPQIRAWLMAPNLTAANVTAANVTAANVTAAATAAR